jgi:hypothetical protein
LEEVWRILCERAEERKGKKEKEGETNKKQATSVLTTIFAAPDSEHRRRGFAELEDE